MADGELTVKIEPVLAERLTRAAQAAGESVDAFVNGLLDTEAVGDPDWADIDRICEGAAETGVPWEDFEPRLRGLGVPAVVHKVS
ncbi:MAG: hypothetical protein ACXWVH_02355 [Caulobacteraceae bacterium]